MAAAYVARPYTGLTIKKIAQQYGVDPKTVINNFRQLVDEGEKFEVPPVASTTRERDGATAGTVRPADSGLAPQTQDTAGGER